MLLAMILCGLVVDVCSYIVKLRPTRRETQRTIKRNTNIRVSIFTLGNDLGGRHMETIDTPCGRHRKSRQEMI